MNLWRTGRLSSYALIHDAMTYVCGHRSTGNVAAAAAASGSESSAPLDQQVLDTSIELAHKLADAAAQITRQYFRCVVVVCVCVRVPVVLKSCKSGGE